MIGPSLPDQSSNSNGQRSSPSTSRRVMGPMLPDSNQQSETSEGMSLVAKEFIDRQERIRLASEHDQSQSGSAGQSSKQTEQRPEWMLAPPSASGISDMFNKDPTAALKARGFNQSANMRVQRTATVPTNPDDIDSVSWTETPQERAKRLYEEQMGIRKVNGSGSSSALLESQQLEEERKREERVRQAIQAHQASRGPSLLEQHQAKRRKDLRDKDSRSDRDDRHRRHHSRRSKTSDDEESRSSRHRRHRRERSQSDSDDAENHSRSRDKDREYGRSSRHGEERRDRHASRHHSSGHSSSRRSHRSRSRSRSPSRERDSERSRAQKREEKEVRREKERKKRRRDEEEREEKRGAPTMIWDREAALSVGGQLMDERKRTDFIKSSTTLSDRFGQGSSKYM